MLLDQVDVESLKEEYDLYGAFKNGPRLWTLDWVEVIGREERDFNGLKARWVTWLDVGGGGSRLTPEEGWTFLHRGARTRPRAHSG